ncbi:MAG: hypothetical protein K2P52_02395 [Campylobacterales bacterium]|nr:hypothetical protein [Campylobacterales bacterium]
MDEGNKILNCEYVDSESLMYYNEYGYRLSIICKDMFEDEDKINKIGNMITLRNKRDVGYLYGDTILMDEDKSLKREDVNKIMRIGFSIDWEKYEREMNEKTAKMIEEMNKLFG